MENFHHCATGSSSFCLYATFLLHNYSCLCLATFLICWVWIVKAVAAQRCFAALTIQAGRFFINQAQARITGCLAPLIQWHTRRAAFKLLINMPAVAFALFNSMPAGRIRFRSLRMRLVIIETAQKQRGKVPGWHFEPKMYRMYICGRPVYRKMPGETHFVPIRSLNAHFLSVLFSSKIELRTDRISKSTFLIGTFFLGNLVAYR